MEAIAAEMLEIMKDGVARSNPSRVDAVATRFEINGRDCGSEQSKLSFLFSGVKRGYFSFSEGAQLDHEGDEPLITAKGFHWREADLRLPIMAQ